MIILKELIDPFLYHSWNPTAIQTKYIFDVFLHNLVSFITKALFSTLSKYWHDINAFFSPVGWKMICIFNRDGGWGGEMLIPEKHDLFLSAHRSILRKWHLMLSFQFSCNSPSNSWYSRGSIFNSLKELFLTGCRCYFPLREASFIKFKPPYSIISLAQDYLECPCSSWMDVLLCISFLACPKLHLLVFFRRIILIWPSPAILHYLRYHCFFIPHDFCTMFSFRHVST